MPQVINSSKTSSKVLSLAIDKANIDKIEAFAFNGATGENFDWKKVSQGTLGLINADANNLRKTVRDYISKNLIPIADYEKIVEDTKTENAKVFDYFSKNPEKFYGIADNQLFIAGVQTGTTKKGLIILNMAKLKKEVEISTGEKVKKADKKTE